MEDQGQAHLDFFRVSLPDGGATAVRPLAIVTPEGQRTNPEAQLFLVHVPSAGEVEFQSFDIGANSPNAIGGGSNKLSVDEGLAVVVRTPAPQGRANLAVTHLGALDTQGVGSFGVNAISTRQEKMGEKTRVSFVAAFDVGGQTEGVVALGTFDVLVREGKFEVEKVNLVRLVGAPCEGGSPVTPRRFVRQLAQGALVCGPLYDDAGSDLVAGGVTGFLRPTPEGGVDHIPNLGDAPQGSFIVTSTWHANGSKGHEILAVGQERSNFAGKLINFDVEARERGTLLGTVDRFILVDVPLIARVNGKAGIVLHCPPMNDCVFQRPGMPDARLVSARDEGTTGVLLVGIEDVAGRLAIASYEWLPVSQGIAAPWPFALLGAEVVELPAAAEQPRRVDVSLLFARRVGNETHLAEVRRRYAWIDGVRQQTAEVTHPFAEIEHTDCTEAQAPWEDARTFVVTLGGVLCDGLPSALGECATSADADRFAAWMLVPVGDHDCDGVADRYSQVTYHREGSRSSDPPFAGDKFFVSPAALEDAITVNFPSSQSAEVAVARMRIDGVPSRVGTSVTVPKRSGERRTGSVAIVTGAASVSMGTPGLAPHTVLRSRHDAARNAVVNVR